jgi:hypothetical protein
MLPAGSRRDNARMSKATSFDPARVQAMARETLQIEVDAVAALTDRIDGRFV